MQAPDPRAVPVSSAAHERAANYSAAIYGSILVTALVATLDEEHADAQAMSIALLSTTIVFWLAHVWADVVGERIETGKSFTVGRCKLMARRQWPMIEAAAAPVAALVLAWAGVLALDVAVWLALVIGIVQLGAWGMVVGFRSSSAWPLAVASGLVNATFGLVIVALKALVH